MIVWLGSPQHEELYSRVPALGRLRATLLWGFVIHWELLMLVIREILQLCSLTGHNTSVYKHNEGALEEWLCLGEGKDEDGRDPKST